MADFQVATEKLNTEIGKTVASCFRQLPNYKNVRKCLGTALRENRDLSIFIFGPSCAGKSYLWNKIYTDPAHIDPKTGDVPDSREFQNYKANISDEEGYQKGMRIFTTHNPSIISGITPPPLVRDPLRFGTPPSAQLSESVGVRVIRDMAIIDKCWLQWEPDAERLKQFLKDDFERLDKLTEQSTKDIITVENLDRETT